MNTRTNTKRAAIAVLSILLLAFFTGCKGDLAPYEKRKLAMDSIDESIEVMTLSQSNNMFIVKTGSGDLWFVDLDPKSIFGSEWKVGEKMKISF